MRETDAIERAILAGIKAAPERAALRQALLAQKGSTVIRHGAHTALAMTPEARVAAMTADMFAELALELEDDAHG